MTLAVSLHAPDDALREELVPLNRRYPIAEVLDAARATTPRRRAGGSRSSTRASRASNDHPHQADALADRLRGFRGGAHVNLIPLNPTSGFGGHAAGPDRIARFAARLRERGVQASIRRNRGVDIDAACGQLRARTPGAGTAEPNPPAASATMDQ